MTGRVLRPSGLAELWPLLDDGFQVLAGGTDLLVRARQAAPTRILDLALLDGIPALGEISTEGTLIRLGATATHSALLAHPLLRDLPVLTRALTVLGSPLIRNMGTIGGNIVTASPAGDTLPPLYALEAEVELASRQGTRRLPLEDFITAPGRTVLASGEILTAVLLPPPPPSLQHFEKVGRRAALAIAVASLAAVLTLDSSGRVRRARLAVGSLAPTVLRCHSAEDALLGRRLDAEALTDCGRLIRSVIAPIDDIRATATYRRRIAGRLPLRLVGVSGSGQG